MAAILLPALQNARERGRTANCLNNLKQGYHFWNSYSDDFNDFILPARIKIKKPDGNWSSTKHVQVYIADQYSNSQRWRMNGNAWPWICPSNPTPIQNGGTTGSVGFSFYFDYNYNELLGEGADGQFGTNTTILFKRSGNPLPTQTLLFIDSWKYLRNNGTNINDKGLFRVGTSGRGDFAKPNAAHGNNGNMLMADGHAVTQNFIWYNEKTGEIDVWTSPRKIGQYFR